MRKEIRAEKHFEPAQAPARNRPPVPSVPQVLPVRVQAQRPHEDAHRGEAVPVSGLRQKFRQQKQLERPPEDPQHREDVEVSRMSWGGEVFQDERGPGPPHGLPLRAEARLSEMRAEVPQVELFGQALGASLRSGLRV